MNTKALQIIWNLRETKSLGSFHYVVKIESDFNQSGSITKINGDKCTIFLGDISHWSNNQLCFLLAHEMAHLINNDQSFWRANFTSSIKKEKQADQLAIKAMLELNILLSEDEISGLFNKLDINQSKTHPSNASRYFALLDSFINTSRS